MVCSCSPRMVCSHSHPHIPLPGRSSGAFPSEDCMGSPGIEQDKFGYGCMKLFCKFVQRVSFLYTITDSILTIHIFFHKNIFRLFYEILRVWLPNWNHLIIPLLIEFDNRSCGCINFIAVLIASSFKFNLINRHAIIPIQFSLHLKSIGTCNTGMG